MFFFTQYTGQIWNDLFKDSRSYNTHIKCLCLHTLSPVAKKKNTLFHFSDVSAVFAASSEFISEWEKNIFFAHKVMWCYNKQ